MSEKTSTSKRTPAPAKPVARKSASVTSPPAQAVAAKTKVAVAAKPVKKNKKAEKVSKVKVVRDSFTMPQNDYAKIAELKEVCLKANIQVKKSELLRAGLHALSKLSTAQLKQTLAQMEQIKTGRPKNG